jgi:release factor glutamine methyltransferase
LKVTIDYLKKKEIDSPRLTAEVLLAHQLKVDRVTLYVNFDQPLSEKEISGYRLLIKRRIRREPLQYITGVQEFWSLDFIVDARVLIPRSESELLVELAIQQAKGFAVQENHPPTILDLGTGCGALAISLAQELQQAQICATDISASALELAHLNAKKHGLSDRIQFMQGDLWTPLMNQGISFDIIVSNPPYVASEEYNNLAPEIRDYEPRLALDGQEGGMYYIEKVIMGAQDFINPGGWMMLEMAPNQTDKALGLIERIRSYGERARIKDYNQQYRVVMAQKKLQVS